MSLCTAVTALQPLCDDCLQANARLAAHDRPEPQSYDAERDVKTLAPFKRKKSSFPLVCPLNLAPQAVLCLPEPYASLHTFAPLHCAVQSVYSDEYNDAGTMPSETVHTTRPVTALLVLMSICRTTHRATSLDPWVLFLPGWANVLRFHRAENGV